jgi:hypothetical protein
MLDQNPTIYDAAKNALLGGALYSIIASSIPTLPAYTITLPGNEASEYATIESLFVYSPNYDQTTAIAILQSAKLQDALAVEFAKLTAKWKMSRSASSSTISIVIDPSYQRIISLGSKVLPLILQELARETDHWFWALRVISGDDPVAAQDRGNVKKMAAAWLEWGRKQGYV